MSVRKQGELATDQLSSPLSGHISGKKVDIQLVTYYISVYFGHPVLRD